MFPKSFSINSSTSNLIQHAREHGFLFQEEAKQVFGAHGILQTTPATPVNLYGRNEQDVRVSWFVDSTLPF